MEKLDPSHLVATETKASKTSVASKAREEADLTSDRQTTSSNSSSEARTHSQTFLMTMTTFSVDDLAEIAKQNNEETHSEWTMPFSAEEWAEDSEEDSVTCNK